MRKDLRTGTLACCVDSARGKDPPIDVSAGGRVRVTMQLPGGPRSLEASSVARNNLERPSGCFIGSCRPKAFRPGRKRPVTEHMEGAPPDERGQRKLIDAPSCYIYEVERLLMVSRTVPDALWVCGVPAHCLADVVRRGDLRVSELIGLERSHLALRPGGRCA